MAVVFFCGPDRPKVLFEGRDLFKTHIQSFTFFWQKIVDLCFLPDSATSRIKATLHYEYKHVTYIYVIYIYIYTLYI